MILQWSHECESVFLLRRRNLDIEPLCLFSITCGVCSKMQVLGGLAEAKDHVPSISLAKLSASIDCYVVFQTSVCLLTQLRLNYSLSLVFGKSGRLSSLNGTTQ